MALGKKTGGRKKGVGNKTLKAQRAELAASGLMPLPYMLAILRDPEATKERRDWAADKAAKFCHPSIAPKTAEGTDPVTRVLVGWLEGDG